MRPLLTGLLVASYVVALLAGGTVTVLSFRAYRRTGSRELGTLSLGFGLLTVSLAGHPATDLLLGTDSRSVPALSAPLSAAGFGLLVYSVYTRTEQVRIEESASDRHR